jgi:transcription factor IIIB subunit 2
MVKKGSKFSKRINYDAIESLFGSGASKDADLENGGKLYTFDKDRDSSVDAEDIRRKEYPYDERHEHDDDMDGEGEIIIEEDGSGGVGFSKTKKDRDRSRSRGAVSERTDDVTEYDGEGEADETMADDDMASHRGDTSYGDYNYDDAYEQEV